MGNEEMTVDEMKTILIGQFCDLQEIKKENGEYQNEILAYKIREIDAKLSSLGVNTENLTL